MSPFYKRAASVGIVLATMIPAGAWAQGLGLGLGLIPSAPKKTIDHKFDAKLVVAVKAKHLDEVQALLKQGADPNTKDTDKFTMPVLTLASGEYEDLPILQALLADGADIEGKNSQGATPLVLASLANHAPAIKYLLKAGAKVDAPTSMGLTALMLAASTGQLENVLILLTHGANVNALSNDKGTALFYGSSKTYLTEGKLNVIKALVGAGADVSVKASNGKTALQMAQAGQLTDIANYLAEIETRDTTLFNAAARAYNERKTAGSTAWEDVKKALDAGANPHFASEDGRTALMFLAYGVPGSDDATLQRIVAHSDLSAREQTFDATALHLAVNNDNIALVTLLLKAGAPRDLKTKAGKTPLDLAMARGNKSILALFESISPPTTDDDADMPYFV